MKALVLQFDGVLIARELEDIKEDLKNQLEKDGFIIIDNRFKVYEVEVENEK